MCPDAHSLQSRHVQCEMICPWCKTTVEDDWHAFSDVRWRVKVGIGQDFRLCCKRELELRAVWQILFLTYVVQKAETLMVGGFTSLANLGCT